MSFSFPQNPTLNQTYTRNSITWAYNGKGWTKSTAGGASVTSSATAPASPTDGSMWLDSESGDLYVYGGGNWILTGVNPGPSFSGSYNDLTDKPTITSVSPSAISDQPNTSTGYFDLPSGTTAQRPVSATTGALRLNTETNYLEMYNGTVWVSLQYAGAMIAATYTGATETTVGNYKVLTYTSSGTFNVTTAPIGAAIEVLIVGGGGGGTGYGGAGAGAEVLSIPAYAVAATGYTITIGAGGSASGGGGTGLGISGSSTSAFGEIAKPGGGGRGTDYTGTVPTTAQVANGGGGGARSAPYAGAVGTSAGTGVIRYGGYTGGAGQNSQTTSETYPCGGGAGAGGNGGTPTSTVSNGGNGGIGVQNAINGTNYYWGGGGGAMLYYPQAPYRGGNGGLGGGGAGWGGGTGGSLNGTPGLGFNSGGAVSGYNAGAGGANTGGGGGSGAGDGAGNAATGGNGGSGIVIVKYRYQ